MFENLLRSNQLRRALRQEVYTRHSEQLAGPSLARHSPILHGRKRFDLTPLACHSPTAKGIAGRCVVAKNLRTWFDKHSSWGYQGICSASDSGPNPRFDGARSQFFWFLRFSSCRFIFTPPRPRPMSVTNAPACTAAARKRESLLCRLSGQCRRCSFFCRRLCSHSLSHKSSSASCRSARRRFFN